MAEESKLGSDSSREPTLEEIVARAASICRKDGMSWMETSASEASFYMKVAEQELRSGHDPKPPERL